MLLKIFFIGLETLFLDLISHFEFFRFQLTLRMTFLWCFVLWCLGIKDTLIFLSLGDI